MRVDAAVAKDLKLGISMLYDTPHGQVLLEYLKDKAGHYAPTYNPDSSTSIITAAGRQEMVMILRNLDRLTEEQIVELEGQ